MSVRQLSPSGNFDILFNNGAVVYSANVLELSTLSQDLEKNTVDKKSKYSTKLIFLIFRIRDFDTNFNRLTDGCSRRRKGSSVPNT